MPDEVTASSAAAELDAALEEGEVEEKGELIDDVEAPGNERRHRAIARTSKEICCRLGKVATWASCGSCFTYLMQAGLLGMAAYWIYVRDRLYEYRRRIHSWYDLLLIYQFRTLKVDCETFRQGGEDQATYYVDDLVDSLDVNSTVEILEAALEATEGLGNLTKDEYLINHCDGNTMERIFNMNLREEERRDPDCVFTDRDGPQCVAGMFQYLPVNYTDFGQARVEPAPPGYFSPEFFKCLIRCPGGAGCLQSHHHYPPDSLELKHDGYGNTYSLTKKALKCTYALNVDRSQKPVAVVDDESKETRYYCALPRPLVLICLAGPGARYLYLCPAGYECPSPETPKPCPRGHYCPRGSRRAHACDGALPFYRQGAICDGEMISFPDYSKPASLFFVACVSLPAPSKLII